jgi:hypothetical protein
VQGDDGLGLDEPARRGARTDEGGMVDGWETVLGWPTGQDVGIGHDVLAEVRGELAGRIGRWRLSG